MVAARWQLANAEVDDDQRHSTLLLYHLLGRLLEDIKDRELLSCFLRCCFALPLIDFKLHILTWLAAGNFDLSEFSCEENFILGEKS